MRIDTRGPARRRETVRDKNANGKSTEKDKPHERRTQDDATMRASRRTKKNDGGGRTELRNADRRSELWGDGGARSVPKLTADERCAREVKWSAAAARVDYRMSSTQCSLLTTVYCSGHTNCRPPPIARPPEHSLPSPPPFPPVHKNHLAAHPPVRTVLSSWARIVPCAAAS